MSIRRSVDSLFSFKEAGTMESLSTKASLQVPELSLARYINGSKEEKAQFSTELFNGLKYFGFIILKDHPVEESSLENAYKLSQIFFQLPKDVKNKYLCKDQGTRTGYIPFGKEHAKGNMISDLKEFWHICQKTPRGHELESLYPENIWPTEIIDFETVFTELFKRLDDVAQIMLEALTAPLKIPQDYFLNLTQYGDSILRLLHYPPLDKNQDPNCVRAAAHEDINLITLLVSASSTGLEILDRQGHWLPIKTSAKNIIVDAGDALSRITENVIPSTTHRVVNPKEGENVSRYSIPYFMHPKPTSTLSSIESCRSENSNSEFPDILARDFLMKRLREIGLA